MLANDRESRRSGRGTIGLRRGGGLNEPVAGRLLVGQIGKPHGITGEVYVERISDDPRRWDPGSRLIHENGSVLVVASSRPHRDRFLVTFEEIDTRNQAELLRGALYVSDDEMRELDEDEYWLEDLIGATANDAAGELLGEVTGVVEGRAQDLLVLATPAGERYIPMVKEIVLSVDVAAKEIVVDPPEGLLD
ncbi:MAG: ribosome maturation factor RimM [Actinomycetota bacterium]